MDKRKPYIWLKYTVTLKAINLWYGFGAHAYTSTELFNAITKNLILSYFTEIEENKQTKKSAVIPNSFQLLRESRKWQYFSILTYI